jgi:hypothetical protein
MARGLLGRLRPRNWLDAFGFAVQIVGLIGLIDAIIHQFTLNPSPWWLWTALSGASLTVAFIGHVIRRLATGKPIFKD